MPLGKPVKQCLVELGLLPATPNLKKEQWPRNVKELCEGFDSVVDAVVKEHGTLQGTDDSARKLSRLAQTWVNEYASVVLPTCTLDQPT